MVLATVRTEQPTGPEIWGSQQVCGSLHHLECCLTLEKFQNRGVCEQSNCATPSMNLVSTERFGLISLLVSVIDLLLRSGHRERGAFQESVDLSLCLSLSFCHIC